MPIFHRSADQKPVFPQKEKRLPQRQTLPIKRNCMAAFCSEKRQSENISALTLFLKRAVLSSRLRPSKCSFLFFSELRCSCRTYKKYPPVLLGGYFLYNAPRLSGGRYTKRASGVKKLVSPALAVGLRKKLLRAAYEVQPRPTAAFQQCSAVFRLPACFAPRRTPCSGSPRRHPDR